MSDLQASTTDTAKRPSKTPSQSEVFTTQLVMPSDTNPHETLFGGALVSWIDKVAAMSAQRHAGTTSVVTASIDHMTFRTPVFCGDQVVLGAMVNWAGKSSMEVGVKVMRIDPFDGDRDHVATAYLTFVAIGGVKPIEVPSILCETEEDQRRFREAEKRRQIRMQHKKFFEEKV